MRRLTEAGTVTASGKPFWDRSGVWGMLRNPAYMGRAALGKTQACDHQVRVRAQRHSADVPRKPYSAKRVDPQQWIEIPVPAIVSEALFQTVQEQLAENRKLARQRRDSAPLHLLQGLTVCGHCRYAYYAKKVSKAAAKGKPRDYVYYVVWEPTPIASAAKASVTICRFELISSTNSYGSKLWSCSDIPIA
nr:recombinase family protein [Cupriavidus metallidurans]